MDQELLSHLDQRLGEFSRQIAETLDRQMTAPRQETKDQIASLRQEMKGEIASFRQEVNERLARVEDGVHQTQVTVEAMRRDVQLEEHAARQNQNAIDLIRERFGKASKAQ